MIGHPADEDHGFVALSLRGGVSGVYLLLLRGVVVYAGQSTNVFARLGNHWQAVTRSYKNANAVSAEPITKLAYPYRMEVEFDEVRVKFVPKAALDAEEIKLIQRYQPRHNEKLNRAAPPVGASPALAKALEGILSKRIKRRKLPDTVQRIEEGFRRGRDQRMKITLPRVSCLEAE
jgi:hypothetical protein